MSGLDRHAEDISHALQAMADALERPRRGAWLKLPSGRCLNMAHIAKVQAVTDDNDRRVAVVQWAVSAGAELGLCESRYFEDDALAIRAWLDAETRP